MILTPSGMEVWGSFFVVVLLLKISHRRGLQVLRLVSVPEFGTAKGVGPDFSSCCCHLIPGTLLLLRNMHFLLVSSGFWLWLWGREEVFYSIIYFQKSNFEIAGLLVGSVLLKLTLEGPGEGRREGCGAGSWELGAGPEVKNTQHEFGVSLRVNKPQLPHFSKESWGIDRAALVRILQASMKINAKGLSSSEVP